MVKLLLGKCFVFFLHSESLEPCAYRRSKSNTDNRRLFLEDWASSWLCFVVVMHEHTATRPISRSLAVQGKLIQ